MATVSFAAPLFLSAATRLQQQLYPGFLGWNPLTLPERQGGTVLSSKVQHAKRESAIFLAGLPPHFAAHIRCVTRPRDRLLYKWDSRYCITALPPVRHRLTYHGLNGRS